MRYSSIALVLALGAFLLLAGSVNTSAQIVYKVPGGGFPMDWNKSGFKGMLFLEKDSPSGLFIAFPEKEESMDDLRERAAKFIAPMFLGDAKDKNSLSFQIKKIPSSKEDIIDRGRHYFLAGEKTSVQIFFFERTTPAANVLYGYFAMKDNAKGASKIWVGDDLKFPKSFSKFVASFNGK